MLSGIPESEGWLDRNSDLLVVNIFHICFSNGYLAACLEFRFNISKYQSLTPQNPQYASNVLLSYYFIMHLYFLCYYQLHMVYVLVQDDHICRRLGFHLCHFCHVLCASQFCGFPDPGESEQGQTYAVHQWSKTSYLLVSQLRVGYGKRLK